MNNVRIKCKLSIVGYVHLNEESVNNKLQLFSMTHTIGTDALLSVHLRELVPALSKVKKHD